jgi:hypothetical protein
MIHADFPLFGPQSVHLSAKLPVNPSTLSRVERGAVPDSRNIPLSLQLATPTSKRMYPI